MMKNIKDITISIFAVIGLVAIITAFTNQPEQGNYTICGTPESHEWTISGVTNTSGKNKMFILNKRTGEVRHYENEKRILPK